MVIASGRSFFLDSSDIFVYKRQKGTIAAHPINPDLIGKNSVGLKDIKGNLFFIRLCEAAKESNRDWTQYWWPKPGDKDPSRKVSLMLQVPNTTYHQSIKKDAGRK